MRNIIAFFIGGLLSALLLSSHAAPATPTAGGGMHAPAPLVVSLTRPGGAANEAIPVRETDEASRAGQAVSSEPEPRWMWLVLGLVCMGLLANGRRRP